MSIAAAFNTTQIWIVNVGSLKPLEMPTEHFLNLAWDIDAWPINSVDRYLEHWAAREFGDDVSHEVADIMAKYSVSYFLHRLAPDGTYGDQADAGRCTRQGTRPSSSTRRRTRLSTTRSE